MTTVVNKAIKTTRAVNMDAKRYEVYTAACQFLFDSAYIVPAFTSLWNVFTLHQPNPGQLYMTSVTYSGLESVFKHCFIKCPDLDL